MVSYAIVAELNEIKLQASTERLRKQLTTHQETDLYVSFFGGLTICGAHGTLHGDQITADQCYQLLVYLLLHRKRVRPLRELADVLWPEAAVADPYRDIKNVVYRLKRFLVDVGLVDLVIGSSGSFIINPKYMIYVDFERFEKAYVEFQTDSSLAVKATAFEMAREELGEEVTLSAFLEEVALVADIDGVDKDDNKVLLMTIHSAKGLEFSHVYLAGMEDGVFPSYMTITSDDPMDIEEERRLAYVGITRAKEDLTISYAKARMLRGETQYNPVSRFVKEIPPELMDNKLPSIRKWDQNAYETDSYERSHFKAKPFQTGMPQNSFGGRGQQKVQLSDTVFDKPKNNWAAAETVRNNWESSTINTSYQKTTGVTKTKQVKDLSEIIGSRPKAVVKKKETPSANKPYIAKSLDGLSKGVPTTSGGLGYQAGDRVQHIKYGEGTVLKIEQDTRDYKVTVAFDEAGNKIMYAAFAKLRKAAVL